MSLLIHGLNSCPLFPIVSYRDAHPCARLKAISDVISKSLSVSSAGSARTLPFLRALRVLRGSIFVLHP